MTSKWTLDEKRFLIVPIIGLFCFPGMSQKYLGRKFCIFDMSKILTRWVAVDKNRTQSSLAASANTFVTSYNSSNILGLIKQTKSLKPKKMYFVTQMAIKCVCF